MFFLVSLVIPFVLTVEITLSQKLGNMADPSSLVFWTSQGGSRAQFLPGPAQCLVSPIARLSIFPDREFMLCVMYIYIYIYTRAATQRRHTEHSQEQ